MESFEIQDILDEELLVHPTAHLKNGKMFIDARIITSIKINNKYYEISDVVELEVKEIKQ